MTDSESAAERHSRELTEKNFEEAKNNGLEWKGGKTTVSKEVDLCRSCAMTSDLDTLMTRALKAYDKEELTAFESITVQRGWFFLNEFQALAQKWDKALQNLYEMSDRDILKIGYE